MQRFLERISILSLSFMLVSTFAVSPALPAMLDHFAKDGYSEQQVGFLITVTSFAIMTSLILNPVLTRWLSERTMISIGLILVALGGSVPLLSQVYAILFIGRIFLGFGIGMINARAINMVSTHFKGKERLQMMGLRGSTEVLGSAILTAIVGALLGFGWPIAFSIYLLALVVLFLYLRFVPAEADKAEESLDVPKAKLSQGDWLRAIGLAVIAFFVINVNSALTLRIPVMVQESGIATPQQASLILSSMMLMGILAGMVFSHLLGRLKNALLPVSVLIFSLCILLVTQPMNLLVLYIGAMVTGFFYSLVLTLVFNMASEQTPHALLNSVMTIILVGCNTGGATSSLLPPLLEKLPTFGAGAYGIYALVGLVLSLILFWKMRH
ncbi:MFS transporter [Streptococcus rifensis]